MMGLYKILKMKKFCKNKKFLRPREKITLEWSAQFPTVHLSGFQILKKNPSSR